MTSTNEVEKYIENKKEIFSQLIDAISLAYSTRKRKIYLKGIKVLEEEVDILSSKEEWPRILEKALAFFESIEDYEMCQHCKTIKDSIETKKKLTMHAEKSTKKRNEET